MRTGGVAQGAQSELCDDLEGGMVGGEREGVCVCIELINFIMRQKLTQLCKAIILQAFFLNE